MDVLKTIDFDKYKFGIMTIEDNDGDSIMADFMALQGYRVVETGSIDLFFMPYQTLI